MNTSPEKTQKVIEKETQSQGEKLNKSSLLEIVKKYGIVFVLILMVIAIIIAEPKFMSATNILNVLTQSSIYGIMALGLKMVIISKGIDLSAGSILAFAGVVATSLGQISTATTKYFPNLPEMPIILPILAAIVIGVLLGVINGGFIAYTGIPAFIAALGMQNMARGFTLMYTGGKPVSQLTSSFMFIGGKIGIIHVPVIIYGLMILISWILLNHTSFGNSVYAIDGNIKAAEISGINIKRNIIIIYGFCGLMCGVAVLVFAGRVGSVHSGAATGYELTAIASTTIGGTSHAGGIGTVWGAVVGALILPVLRNGLTLLGVQAYWQQVVEGAIIISAVVIDMRKNARKR